MKEQPETFSVFNATYTIGNIVPREEHLKGRIPSSIFYDFNEFSNKSSQFSYTLPSEAEFASQMRVVNVRKSDTVVVYDKIGMVSAPRAYWLLKTFGIKNVLILDGVFGKWQTEGRAIETGESESAWKKIRATQAKEDDFRFSYNQERVRHFEDMVNLVKNPDHGIPIIDSRFDNIFSQGNIPGSKNLPFTGLLNPDKTFKSAEEIKKVLQSVGIENPESAPIISTCQRGITACILEVALDIIGNNNTTIYDGSYEEFSKRNA
jgi:thiosulfate/3-mercaptopyruvate sulfurtransferase